MQVLSPLELAPTIRGELRLVDAETADSVELTLGEASAGLLSRGQGGAHTLAAACWRRPTTPASSPSTAGHHCASWCSASSCRQGGPLDGRSSGPVTFLEPLAGIAALSLAGHRRPLFPEGAPSRSPGEQHPLVAPARPRPPGGRPLAALPAVVAPGPPGAGGHPDHRGALATGAGLGPGPGRPDRGGHR